MVVYCYYGLPMTSPMPPEKVLRGFEPLTNLKLESEPSD
jgi:hypothetical protein